MGSQQGSREMSRIAFISFFPAYPPTSGAGAVTYNSVRYAEVERLLIQMGAAGSEEVLGDGLVVVTDPWPRRRWRRLAALRRRIREIVSCVTAFQPDLVVLEGASWVMYHWLLLRELRTVHGANLPVWYHGHNVEYILRRQKHGQLVRQLTCWAEGRLLRSVDRLFAVSTIDQQQFRDLYGVEAELWPNGVDVAQFAKARTDQVNMIRKRYGLDSQTVLFMGMYAYHPNREAIDFLFDDAMPRVRQTVPDAKLAILGGDVPYHADWLITPGRIPHTDLPAFIKACNVGAAPIFSGSGTRLKILEYLAAGLPVVATPKGAEGLDLDPDKCLQMAEGECFADMVVRALVDPQEANARAHAGYEVVRQRYDWRSILANVGLAESKQTEDAV